MPRFETAEPPLAPVRPPDSAPEKSEPRVRVMPPALLDPQPVKPATAAEVPEPLATPPLPVGIPKYAEVKTGAATGLRPDPEGLDWLKDKGFKSVLHLRNPGAVNSADREQVEKRGLKYLSLEVAPETLDASLMNQFNKIVADPANAALFVYDKDGALAGAMWYLHFRSIDKVSADTARVRAESFGLKPADTDEHKALWLAIQKINLP
jgi:protein tyrosine phosphatase (PTP) superfamily phosphohydrolase (DUF442 family)